MASSSFLLSATATFTLLCVLTRCLPCAPFESFKPATNIQNVAQDPKTGRVYIGATDNLYQLNANLELETWVKNKPIPPEENKNRLLLVYPSGGSLIVCGTAYDGACSLLNLTDISDSFCCEDTGGESKMSVGKDHRQVTGLVSSVRLKGHQLDILVIANKLQGSGKIPYFLSMHLLQRDRQGTVVFGSMADLTFRDKPKFDEVGFHMFQDGDFVYVVYSRLTHGRNRLSKRSLFVSRFFVNDTDFYSYMELPLTCGKKGGVSAVTIAPAGLALAQQLSALGEHGSIGPADQVLFGVFGEVFSLQSLCLYPLKSINRALEKIRTTCYEKEGMLEGEQVVYQSYSQGKANPCPSKESLASGTAVSLPGQLAGSKKLSLHSQAVISFKYHQVTSVAVTGQSGHTVALLGTLNGNILKVHLAKRAVLYDTVYGDTIKSYAVDKIFFDNNNNSNIYIVSLRMIYKTPVQSCHMKTDCQSCVALRDPYCGWCVLEGRCTTKGSCGKAEDKNMWLWSPDQLCLTIQTFSPPYLSCQAHSQILKMEIPLLPTLAASERLDCEFGAHHSTGQVQGTQVSCLLPGTPLAQCMPRRNQDHVSVPVTISVAGGFKLVTGEFHFYSCAAVVRTDTIRPCVACVTREWACQWDTQTQACRDLDDTVEGAHIVKHKQMEKCPLFEMPTPTLMSVGVKTHFSFVGKNLLPGKQYVIGTDLLENYEDDVTYEGGSAFSFEGFELLYDKAQETNVSFYVSDKESGKRIDSKITVLLYNCSVGRDCSLCQNEDPRYRCVWCSTNQMCVHQDHCAQVQDVCPKPIITDVSPGTGPLEGLISIEITGSNLGLRAEDILNITVANIPCTHQPHKYSPSKRVGCEIGPVPKLSPVQGPVEIVLKGGLRAISSMQFTYQDPLPTELAPTTTFLTVSRLITISGQRLDTGSKDDIMVLVGEKRCQVQSTGKQITCKAPPSNKCLICTVTVKYGKNTTRTLPKKYTYYLSPFFDDYTPEHSFSCGGQWITFTGSYLDRYKKVALTAVPPAGDPGAEQLKEELPVYRENRHLIFRVPDVRGVRDPQRVKLIFNVEDMDLNLTDFKYHPDPEFIALSPILISASNIVNITGRGFSIAMTAGEAQAFIDNISSPIISLEDDRIVLQVPSTVIEQRQRGEIRSAIEVKIKFGNCEWVVQGPDKETAVPLEKGEAP